MKTIGYIALHYGKEYLEYSLKSYIDLIEELHVFYSHSPSFGTVIKENCPESERELLEIVQDIAKDKLVWHQVKQTGEGNHRNLIDRFSNGYDLIFTADADEVYDTNTLYQNLKEAHQSNATNFGLLGKVDLWKNFNWQVKDSFYPIRIKKANKRDNTTKVLNSKWWHFGYAQSPEITRYKLLIHGHISEIKKLHGSVERYYQKWLNWTQSDRILHPASKDIWIQAEPFDKTELPEIMKSHPLYDK